MKVAMFPYGGEENPYQRMVRDSLISAGCEVETLERKGRFGGLQPLLSTDADIISCDWMTGVYRGRSHLSTALKYLSSMKDLRSVDTPMVWTVHNIAAHEPPVSKRLEWSAERSLVNRMSGFIHFSKAGETAWNERHRSASLSPSTVVREGNMIDHYPNTSNRSSARKQIGLEIGEDTIVGLCFGHIRPYKGYSTLAEEFLRASPPESVLMIVGPPQDPNEVAKIREIERSAPDKIRTHFRRIPTDEVHLYMNAADIGFTPFTAANNSSTVALMQSFGLPIVLPRIGGLPEAALSWNSMIYEPAALCSTINPAIEFGRQQSAKRTAAIEEIRQRDTWEKLSANFLDLFENVLFNRRHPRIETRL